MNIPAIISNPATRHEFVLLFEAVNSNPNGDPDSGNLPRVDPETMQGLVTDVALKRKIRDYISQTFEARIFIQSKVALNKLIMEGFRKAGVEAPIIKLSEHQLNNEELVDWLSSLEQSGFAIEEEELIYTGESVKEKDIKVLIFEGFDISKVNLKRELEIVVRDLVKASKGSDKKVSTKKREEAQKHLCADFFDIRMFGAVLSTGLNAGQVRGPLQMTFSKSIDPIFQMDLSLTRQARA